MSIKFKVEVSDEITAYILGHLNEKEGRDLPNPKYQPEKINNPKYDEKIPKEINNPEYDKKDPDSPKMIPNPEYQEPTIDNPAFDKNIPISIKETASMILQRKVNAYLSEMALVQMKDVARKAAIAAISLPENSISVKDVEEETERILSLD